MQSMKEQKLNFEFVVDSLKNFVFEGKKCMLSQVPNFLFFFFFKEIVS